jgi:hypothetical protein
LAALLELQLLAPYGTSRTLREEQPRHKRSAAAAKMYLVAVFERFNRPRASAIRQALYTARNEHDLLEVVCDAIPFLEEQASCGYAGNVVMELSQMLPEAYGETLDRLLAQTLRAHKNHRPPGVAVAA